MWVTVDETQKHRIEIICFLIIESCKYFLKIYLTKKSLFSYLKQFLLQWSKKKIQKKITYQIFKHIKNILRIKLI